MAGNFATRSFRDRSNLATRCNDKLKGASGSLVLRCSVPIVTLIAVGSDGMTIALYELASALPSRARLGRAFFPRCWRTRRLRH